MPKKKLLTRNHVAENKRALASLVKALKAGDCTFNSRDLCKILSRALAIIRQLERPRRDYS